MASSSRHQAGAPQSGTFTTCRTCLVEFSSRKEQVAHFGSTWHVTNLRRVAAGLKAHDHEEFAAKEAREEAEKAAADAARHQKHACGLCNKKFAGLKALEQHKRSKKHRNAVKKQAATEATSPVAQQAAATASHGYRENIWAGAGAGAGASERPSSSGHVASASTATAAVAAASALDAADAPASSTQTTASDELDPPLPPQTCLFCTYTGASLEDTCRHERDVHAFKLIDSHAITDMDGLRKQLCLRVGVWHECLYCGRQFGAVADVRRHMLDKGHARMCIQEPFGREYALYYDTELAPWTAPDSVLEHSMSTMATLSRRFGGTAAGAGVAGPTQTAAARRKQARRAAAQQKRREAAAAAAAAAASAAAGQLGDDGVSAAAGATVDAAAATTTTPGGAGAGGQQLSRWQRRHGQGSATENRVQLRSAHGLSDSLVVPATRKTWKQRAVELERRGRARVHVGVRGNQVNRYYFIGSRQVAEHSVK